ncbi:thiamine pyrophosphate-dependent enzyme [Chloroflexota bacterium]
MENSYHKKIAADILRIRFGMMMVNDGIRASKFKIPIHLAFGHEAIAVAVKAIANEEDQLILSHRNIHYNLAKTESLKAEIDEYSLKKCGLAKGQLGSMNLVNEKEGIVYTSSILGNNLSVAAGLALGKKVKNSNGVVIVISGDGSMEEGAFHEGLLFLKSNYLSSIIIVENNEWSLATRISERRCNIDIEKYTSAFDIKYEKLKGNDVYEYIEKLHRLRNYAIENKTPLCVEAEVTTLGDWRMKTEEYPEGKFINYHAGLAPAVHLAEWPILDDSEKDPIFVLQKYFNENDLKEMAREVLQHLRNDANDLY